MHQATFKIFVRNGVAELGEEFAEFCKRLESKAYYIQLRDDNPETKWTLLMVRAIHGDMNMLSAATDHNVSPAEWKTTCKLMRPDLFVAKMSIRNPITGEHKEYLRSLTELSRADVLDWMATYRSDMERIWNHGNPKVTPPVKPLKEVYACQRLEWYSRDDEALLQLMNETDKDIKLKINHFLLYKKHPQKETR